MISQRRRKEKHWLPKPVTFLLFVFLSVAAVNAGVLLGNAASDEVPENYLSGISTDYFKKMLDASFSMINTVYNSGNTSTSISGVFKDFTEFIFGFNLDDPKSVFKANSVLFVAYNVNSDADLYEKLSYSNDSSLDNDSSALNNDKLPNNSAAANPDNIELWEDPGPEEEHLLKEAASSISMDYEPEERNIEDKKVETGEGISIRNETKYKIDIEKLLNERLSFDFNKKDSKVLVYHTHTTESFLKNLADLKKPGVLNRNKDPRYSVVRVGAELTNYLKKDYGMDVIHNGTIHDYPDFNKAYVNSLQTVNNILKGNPSVKVVLDIHRDAITGNKLRLVKNIDGKNAAQIMFVVATGEAGANHPEWRENMKLALKLQKKLNAICPGLARPIYVSQYRYNQHVKPGALLVEIGGDGNLLEECLLSTKYLAKALDEVLGE